MVIFHPYRSSFLVIVHRCPSLSFLVIVHRSSSRDKPDLGATFPLVFGGGVTTPPLTFGGGVTFPLVFGGGVSFPLVFGVPLIFGGGVTFPLVFGGGVSLWPFRALGMFYISLSSLVSRPLSLLLIVVVFLC